MSLVDLERDDPLVLDNGLSKEQIKQKILLQGNDHSNTYNIYGKDVEIVSSKNSSQSRINASNKIKVNRIVNYEWEARYYNGNLIAIHKSGHFFAYSIKVDNSGKVRIFSKKLNEKALLKSFTGRVVDLSFAYCDEEVLLGCVDEIGCLQIYKITITAEAKMETTVVFNLAGFQQTSMPNSSNDNIHRIIWCMYLPDSNDTNNDIANDSSKVFILTRKNQADIFHLDLVRNTYDCSVKLQANEIEAGHLIIKEHTSPILTASFSPDGSAVATAGMDGVLNFIKISFKHKTDDDNENEYDEDQHKSIPTPRCLKQWYPHENKGLSSLYFLDDHKNPSPESQFWSFILTGADYNRELKIWSCSTWECLQTIRFTSPSIIDDIIVPSSQQSISTSTNLNINEKPVLKTAIDLSAKYFVLSDIKRKCFYVLHLTQNIETNQAKFVAISDFILAYPALSFAITDSSQTKTRKYNQLNNVNTSGVHSSNINDDYSATDSLNITGREQNSINAELNTSLNSQSSLVPQLTNDNSENNYLVTSVRLYCIQTKQVQEMTIYLTGDQSINAYNNSSASPPPLQANHSSFGTSFKKSAAGSLSFNADIIQKDLNSSINTSATNLIKINASNSNLKQNENNNTNLNNLNEIDSAIINVIAPSNNLSGSSIKAPILLTPDAFTNSPNNNRSLNSSDQQLHQPIQSSTSLSTSQAKIDLFKTLISSNASTITQTNQSVNLLSSRTSSLTQVTNSTINQPQQNQTDQNRFINKSKKIFKTRNNSSSTSSSSSSSTSSEDEEIAAVLSSSTQQNKKKASELLLNKIELDNVENIMDENISNNKNYTSNNSVNNIDNFSFNLQLNNTNESNLKNNNNLLTPIYANDENKQNETDLKNLLVQMTNVLKSQHDEIENLKKHQINSQIQLKMQIDKTLNTFLNFESKIGAKSVSQDNSSAASVLSLVSKDNTEQFIQEYLNNNFIPKFDKLIKEEIQNSMHSQFVQRLLDPLREQLSRDIAEKLRTIENALKENLSKLFKSKTVIDSLSQSIANTMQATIVNSYRDTFQKVIVPNFEKSCQIMYSQVNNSFSKGTQDYLLEFEQLTKHHRKQIEEYKEPIITQMKQMNEQMQLNNQKLVNEMASSLQIQFDQQIRNSNAILQDTIISSVKAIIKEELQIAMRDQYNVLPDRLVMQMRQSGTMTPVPMMSQFFNQTSNPNSNINSHQETQLRITELIQKGQVNSAFQMALCAADLNLLVNLCELVNPSQVFEQTVSGIGKKTQCQLQQPVILSLIQQLSQDLNSHTDLKVKYLEEAIVNLDLSNPLTREHTPAVMSQLMNKLQLYIQNHPNEKIIKTMRMLLMASQSLINQPKQHQLQQQQSSSLKQTGGKINLLQNDSY